jgi:hypothetical protein
MVRVVVQGRFAVYVYAEGGQPHHLPHCNVRWPGGDAQVSLRDMRVLTGDPLPREARVLVTRHRRARRAAWNALNPRRPR